MYAVEALPAAGREAGVEIVSLLRRCLLLNGCHSHDCDAEDRCIHMPDEAPRSSAQPPAADPAGELPTEAQAEAVRGILQIIRNRAGATFNKVRAHCIARGDNMDLWPAWARDAEGYVTEEGAAMLIYEVMRAAIRKDHP